jgi:hypothetical protein
MKFINLTPHAVTLANGTLRITIEKNPSDPIVRVEHNIIQGAMDYELAPGVKVRIPLEAHQNYKVIGLPDPQPGVIYIVSSMVASRVRRADVVSPLTDATCERAEDGRVLSVKGFQTYASAYGNIEVLQTSEAVEEVAAAIEVIEEEVVTTEPIEVLIASPALIKLEIMEKIEKIDMDMLDPIKAAARAKYEKRMSRTKVRK